MTVTRAEKAKGSSPVLTELRIVYRVRMPSGRFRRYMRPTHAYRLAAKLALGKGASGKGASCTEISALATKLRERDGIR